MPLTDSTTKAESTPTSSRPSSGTSPVGERNWILTAVPVDEHIGVDVGSESPELTLTSMIVLKVSNAVSNSATVVEYLRGS